jgi:hypothetical protein
MEGNGQGSSVFFLPRKDFMMRNAGLLAVVGMLFAGAYANDAKASVSITWGGANDGDNFAYMFSGIVANELTSITGGGYSHNHGATAVVFGIDLHVNGSWVTVETWSHNSADHPLSERTVGGPISFAGGTVDGIRLTDVPIVGNGYHNMRNPNSPTVFTFDSVQSGAVPEPASVAIWSIFGLVVGGVGLRRRNRNRAL